MRDAIPCHCETPTPCHCERSVAISPGTAPHRRDCHVAVAPRNDRGKELSSRDAIPCHCERSVAISSHSERPWRKAMCRYLSKSIPRGVHHRQYPVHHTVRGCDQRPHAAGVRAPAQNGSAVFHREVQPYSAGLFRRNHRCGGRDHEREATEVLVTSAQSRLDRRVEPNARRLGRRLVRLIGAVTASPYTCHCERSVIGGFASPPVIASAAWQSRCREPPPALHTLLGLLRATCNCDRPTPCHCERLPPVIARAYPLSLRAQRGNLARGCAAPPGLPRRCRSSQ